VRPLDVASVSLLGLDLGRDQDARLGQLDISHVAFDQRPLAACLAQPLLLLSGPPSQPLRLGAVVLQPALDLAVGNMGLIHRPERRNDRRARLRDPRVTAGGQMAGGRHRPPCRCGRARADGRLGAVAAAETRF
jgi:hypothetical protein